MNENIQKLYQKVSLVILSVVLGVITMGHPVYGYADIGLEESLPLAQDQDLILTSYSYELGCNVRVVVITWESEFTEDVTNYKIHRRTLIRSTDDIPFYDDDQWITPTHIVARPLGEHKIADAYIEMGVHYNYRLYGFDQSLSLANAKVANLDEVTSFNCIYLPMIYP